MPTSAQFRQLDTAITLWLQRRAALQEEASNLWAKRDMLIEDNFAETNEKARLERSADIEQHAIAAETIEYYARRAYRNAYEHPSKAGRSMVVSS